MLVKHTDSWALTLEGLIQEVSGVESICIFNKHPGDF